MSKYDNVRDILCSKNVRELRTKDQFRDLVYSNKEGIEKVLEGVEQKKWGFTAGKYLLELTGQDVFRKDRNDVRTSFRKAVMEVMKHPAEISTLDFSVCSETKQKVKKTAKKTTSTEPKRKAAMKRPTAQEQMLITLQEQYEFADEQIKVYSDMKKDLTIALRAVSNVNFV